jgi:hypothetical protein
MKRRLLGAAEFELMPVDGEWKSAFDQMPKNDT